jgi:hypothetical protein
MGLLDQTRKLLATFKDHAVAVNRSLDNIRDDNTAIKEKREEIARMPVPKEVALQRLETLVQRHKDHPYAGAEGMVASLVAPELRPFHLTAGM